MPLTSPTPEVDSPEARSSAPDAASAIADLRKREAHLVRVNRALRTISSCSRLLIQAESETELLNLMCRMIVIHGGYRMVWVGFADDDEAKTVRPVAFAGFEEAYARRVRVTWADEPRGNGPTGTAIRKGHAVICRDILMDDKFAPWRDEAIERGYASTIALPIQAKGTVIGAVNIYATEADAFDMEEVNLLQELVNDLAFGIMALRSRGDHRQAVDALRNRDARINSLISTIPDRIYFKDRQSRFVLINNAMATRWARPTSTCSPSRMRGRPSTTSSASWPRGSPSSGRTRRRPGPTAGLRGPRRRRSRFATARAGSTVWSASRGTSRRARTWRRSTSNPRRWRRSASLRAALPTTSTTSWPRCSSR